MEIGADLAAEKMVLTNFLYCQAIKCLTYLSVSPRSDISFAGSRLAKYVEKPRETYWKAVKRMLCYLNDTFFFRLTYGSTIDIDLH